MREEYPLPQAGRRFNDLVGVLGVGALRDLQMEPRGRQPVFPHRSQQDLRDIRLIDVRPGHVDGDRDGRQAGVVPLAQEGTTPVPDEAVQLGDEPVALEEGDELRGGLEAPLGVRPAHQRLRARQAAVPDPVFGLEIDLELPLRQGGLHIVDDGLLPQQLAPQLVVVGGEVLAYIW